MCPGTTKALGSDAKAIAGRADADTALANLRRAVMEQFSKKQMTDMFELNHIYVDDGYKPPKLYGWNSPTPPTPPHAVYDPPRERCLFFFFFFFFFLLLLLG